MVTSREKEFSWDSVTERQIRFLAYGAMGLGNSKRKGKKCKRCGRKITYASGVDKKLQVIAMKCVVTDKPPKNKIRNPKTHCFPCVVGEL